MKARTASLLVAALFVAASPAAPVWAADLLDIYRDAQAQDPVFASARYTYEAARETLPQSRAANLLPSLTFQAGYNRNHRDTQGAPVLDYNTRSYTLSLNQPLFRMQNWIAVDQAELQVKQAEAAFFDARQSLITRAAQAYFDVLLAQDNVDLSAAQKKAVSEQLAQAKRNFEVGTATIVDTYEAQARYDLAVAKEISDQNDLEIKKRALQQLIGKTPAVLATLRDKAPLALPTPADMEAWVKSSDDSSPLIAQFRAAYDIAVKDVSRNKAGHYPTLDLTGSYSDSTSPTTNLFGQIGPSITTKAETLGVVLTIPLYSGGGTQSKIRQAYSNKDRAEQDLENTRRTVAQNVRQSFLGVTNGVAQVKAYEASLVSSQSSLDSTILGREVGVRTNVDILNAQQQLFQTRRDLQQARYATILSQLKLKSAVGTLAEEDLAEVNRMLQR
jgi:outer membrane protein